MFTNNACRLHPRDRKRFADQVKEDVGKSINEALQGYDISPSTIEDLHDEILKVIRGDQ